MGLKVVILINGLGAGGAERSTAEVLPHLRAEGIEPVVVCLHRRSEGVERSVFESGFDLRFLTHRGLLPRVREFRGILTAERPDVVHTTHFESDVIGRVASIGTSIPVLSSLVNTSYDEVRLKDPRVRRWKLRVVKFIDGWTARHLNDHFHAISVPVKNSAAGVLRIPPDRITVVERGRDPARLGEPDQGSSQTVRRSLGLTVEDEIVLNVGRQEFQKGQAHLLEAASILLATRPRAHVLIAGRSGNASEDLEALRAQLELGDRVQFLGHRDDVPALLSAADVFVFPSLYEGLGGAVIEAMALGVPVVASDIPALRSIVEEGRSGLLVPSGSTQAIADAVSRLLHNQEEARSLGRRGREIFESRFTVDKSVEGIVDLYRRVGGMAIS